MSTKLDKKNLIVFGIFGMLVGLSTWCISKGAGGQEGMWAGWILFILGCSIEDEEEEEE